MNPFHCSECNKLLGMIEGKAEIKCPRCKTVNVSKELFESYFIGKRVDGSEYPKSGAAIPLDKVIGEEYYPPGVIPVERISREEIKKRYN
ncbi:hypothetical protein PN4B1_16940 [Paenibacillus naphthalenovorans]|uniref:zinc finger domain-containing protein n=1 Tax=Paenibacillus naphthalenovorans TaxID=162209 RepID=UPI0010B3A736|nr:hypothetical protein PN4B1_16940 [Paenibacillus naphthalenovorans]